VLVAAIDVLVGVSHPLAAINTVNTDKAEPYNAVVAVKRAMQQDQSGQKEGAGATAGSASRPVLLLGSSLVVAPALQCEAIFTGKECSSAFISEAPD
jgi:hypothetical protein